MARQEIIHENGKTIIDGSEVKTLGQYYVGQYGADFRVWQHGRCCGLRITVHTNGDFDSQINVTISKPEELEKLGKQLIHASEQLKEIQKTWD